MARIPSYRGHAAATHGSFGESSAGSVGPFESNDNSWNLHARITGGTESRSFAVGCALVPRCSQVWAKNEKVWETTFVSCSGFRRCWWARQDLNLGPTDYESAALTAELQAPRVQYYTVKNCRTKDAAQVAGRRSAWAALASGRLAFWKCAGKFLQTTLHDAS